MKKERNLSLVVGLMCSILLCAFQTQDKAILPEQLNWNTHFLAKADANSSFFASTATRWQYSYQATVKGNDLHINFKFTAGVDPNQSWVKLNRLRGAESKRKLLNHEQVHANINFLLLKEGEQKIRFQRYTVRNYKKLIQENANKVSAYYRDMQKRYDEETKHGSDDPIQKKWDDLIDDQLKKYIK